MCLCNMHRSTKSVHDNIWVPLAVHSNHLTHGSHHSLEALLVVAIVVAHELEHWQLKPGPLSPATNCSEITLIAVVFKDIH